MRELAYLPATLVMGPIALAYLYCLNDRWRIPARGKVLLMGLSPLLGGLAYLIPLHGLATSLFFWALLLVPTLLCSQVRDERFFFIFFSAMLFTYMDAVVATVMTNSLGYSALFLRLFLDAAMIWLCFYFFRPVFFTFFHNMDRGWLLLLLFPLMVGGFFMLVLTAPGLEARCANPYIHILVYLLSAIVLLVYLLFFQFFRLFRSQLETSLNAALLRSQYEAFTEQLARWNSREDRTRILRHDMRHYLSILNNRLEAGDASDAHQIIASIRAGLSGCLTPSEEEAQRHDT